MTHTVPTSPAKNHSPSPWHVEPLQWDHGASIAVCNKHQGVLAVIDPLNHAQDKASAQREECDYANAYLIAAAPELLEALDYLLEQTVDMDLKYGIGLSEGEEEARAKALAAIAKAKGDPGTGNAI